MRSGHQTNDCDVAILGAGIAGSALAAILARHRVRTVLIDAGTHPRFSIGESTVPTTSLMWHALGKRFGVAEFEHIAGYENVTRHVGRSHGIKKSFGFVRHEDGEVPGRHTAHQLGLGLAGGFEVHLFRQDIDAHIFAAAVRYGAEPRQATRVAELQFDDDGVTLQLERGGSLRTRFVVDATGPGSPFARALGLRVADPPQRTRTRCLFTHMIDLERFDDCLDHPVGRAPFWEGTQHHLFDGGWFWVIPFNNAEHSLNPLVSVGLTLDLDAHPLTDEAPEAEFFRIVDRFPTLKRHFAQARAVRPWVKTKRLQWNSSRTIAPRYAMMASTAGFVGPLFSLGLGHTSETLSWLAPRIMAAVRDDDFDVARFEPVEQMHRRLMAQHDQLVHGSFVAFRDADLWDAWFRVWCLTQMPREMAIIEALGQSLSSGPEAAWSGFETAWSRHPFARIAQAIFDEATAIKDEVAAGTREPAAAARDIMRLFEGARIGPLGEVLRTERHLMVPGRRRAALVSAGRWLLSRERTPEHTGTWMRFISNAFRVNAAS